MPNLRGTNYRTWVGTPRTVRAMARAAGLPDFRDPAHTSVRELATLLGPERYGPRPFYAIARNTNSFDEMVAALDGGYANALEVDVTAYEDRSNDLRIGHEGLLGDGTGDSDDPPLVEYLKQIAFLAARRNELALIVFDCKPPASTPENGKTLRDAIRAHLTNRVPVNVIISTGSIIEESPYRLAGTTIFDEISDDLGAREGLMIDEQDQPSDVFSFFAARGVTRCCYSNGTSFSEEGGSTYRVPVEAACWMRAAQGAFRFIYAWTVDDIEDQHEYMRIGVDGIIANTDSLSQLRVAVGDSAFSGKFRMARRSDNPFMPPMGAYGLIVQTGDVANASTDANVTFRLEGSNGSASTTFDASLGGRMKRGKVSLFVLESRDLGELRSISVQRDDSGLAADWYLSSIRVDSFRYQVHKRADFNRWIDTTDPFTQAL
jgi:hypothetical protein